MNTVWSSYIQSIHTLYDTRRLRFSDRYWPQYQPLFGLEGRSRLLEIGCGPGALAESLTRWYPDADVTGIDRDSAFVAFAQNAVPQARFLEGDAAAVRGCLDGLSGKYKSILQLRHKCHHSWANISVRMGAPDSTVRNWYDKAVLCLGEALDEVPMAEELLERASRARTY